MPNPHFVPFLKNINLKKKIYIVKSQMSVFSGFKIKEKIYLEMLPPSKIIFPSLCDKT